MRIEKRIDRYLFMCSFEDQLQVSVVATLQEIHSDSVLLYRIWLTEHGGEVLAKNL